MLFHRAVTAERINSITKDVIDELARLWFSLYEPDVVDKNIVLLEQHVKALYMDITAESVKRRDTVQEQVDRKLSRD